MLRKTLLTLFASATLGAPVIAPNAALAFGPPPPPAFAGPPPGLAGPPAGLAGPPPGLRLGGSPPHPGLGSPLPRPGAGGPPSRLGGPAGFRGGDRDIPSNVRGLQGAAYAYGHPARYGRGYNAWRDRYGRGYGVHVSGSDGYGYTNANDSCYYTYSYRRHRRVVVCSEE